MRGVFSIAILFQAAYYWLSSEPLDIWYRLHHISFFICMVLLSFALGIKYGKKQGLWNVIFATLCGFVGVVYTSWTLLEVTYLFLNERRGMGSIDLATVLIFGVIIYAMTYFIVFKTNKKFIL